MKQIVKIAFFAVLGLFITFSACKKDNNEQESLIEVGFSVDVPGSHLKSTSNAISDAVKIVLTISKADGSATKYNQTTLTLNTMNGDVFSERILLPSGAYRLTFFVLLDSANNTIFAAPQTGSSLAQFVISPLPMIFNVNANVANIVNVQVLSTVGMTPSNFGLESFRITTVPVFRIMIGVFSLEKNKFITAKLTITPFSRSFNLDSIANNPVTLDDIPEPYTLQIENPEIQTTILKFPADSLKKYSPDRAESTPLIIYVDNLTGTVVDNMGIVYKTVLIGSQWWMVESLKTTRYNNGDPITEIDPYTNITNLPDKKYFSPYGAGNLYYSWYTITDSRGVCPVGWHIPNQAEWQTLIDYNGGSELAGMKLKDPVGGWWMINPDIIVTNESGFSAKASGIRSLYNLDAGEFGYITSFWSSSSVDNNNATSFNMYSESNQVPALTKNKGYGLKIRCIKD